MTRTIRILRPIGIRLSLQLAALVALLLSVFGNALAGDWGNAAVTFLANTALTL
jgi:hypothetical protein